MKDLESILGPIYTSLPQLLGAIVVLIVGYILAKFLAAKLGKIINKNHKIKDMLKDFLGGSEGEAKFIKAVVKIVYYILMIFVLNAVFEALGFSVLTEPLNKFLGSIFSFLPKILGALILLAIAWIVASVVRFLIVKSAKKFKVDEKVSGKEEKEVKLSKALGDIAFWFIFLFFLPGILTALSLEGVLTPVQNMLNEVLDALPNIFAAVIILLIGWFIAKKVKEAATTIFASLGVDKFGKDVSPAGTMKLSEILGSLIYILILIPVIVASLDMIGLSVVALPAMNMIDEVLNYVPVIFSAGVIIYLAYFLGRIVGDMIAGVIAKLNIEKVLIDIGFISESKGYNIGKPVGAFVRIVIVFFAVLEASNILGFSQLTDLVDQFIVLIGHIVLGLIIIGLGLYLAQIFAGFISKKESASSEILALIAKSTIIFLSLAMGLRQMGIANEIINMAFGITLGAVAFAAAIAFGIGGRDTAAKILARFHKEE